MNIAEGDKAPDFSLPTDGGGQVFLAALRGKTVVLYFYPRDNTPGCATEASDFRDVISDFQEANATVIGVSKDSVKRHDNFKAKLGLPFVLASDADGDICERYGVWKEKKLYGRTFMGIERATFLIDAEGVVRKAWRKVRVPGHVADVLEAARAL